MGFGWEAVVAVVGVGEVEVDGMVGMKVRGGWKCASLERFRIQSCWLM